MEQRFEELQEPGQPQRSHSATVTAHCCSARARRSFQRPDSGPTGQVFQERESDGPAQGERLPLPPTLMGRRSVTQQKQLPLCAASGSQR